MESHAMPADGKRGYGAGVERKRRTMTDGSCGGGGGVARRGSLTLMANQLRRLEAGENSTKYHRYFEKERVSVAQVAASPEEGCATVQLYLLQTFVTSVLLRCSPSHALGIELSDTPFPVRAPSG